MKKTILLSLLALSSIALSSCSSKAPAVEESQLSKNLTALRKSAFFEGTYTQSRVFYTDDSFTTELEGQENEDLEAQSTIKFGFTKDAFYRYVATVVDGEDAVYVEDTYVKDEDGYAYKEYLSYENKVEKKYQTTYGNKSSFVNLGYGNPFDNLYEEDFTYNEETKTYSLDLNKASEMFTTLLSFYAAGIVNTGASCTLGTNAKGEFTDLTYVLTPRKVSDYNSMADTTTYYITNQSLTVTVGTIGDEDIVKRLSPVKADESSQISQLKSAFEAFDGNNVEITVKDSPTGGNESYKKMWYDGSSVYVKQYSSVNGGTLDGRDPEYDYILAKNEHAPTLYEARGYNEEIKKWIPSNSTKFGKTSQDKYQYSDLTFDLSKVSTDLFTYDNSKAAFVCENIASGDVAQKGLQPIAKELQNLNLEYATRIEVQVKNSKINKITAHYMYYNYFTSEKVEGDVTFSFRTFGTTKLPYDSKVENVGGNK